MKNPMNQPARFLRMYANPGARAVPRSQQQRARRDDQIDKSFWRSAVPSGLVDSCHFSPLLKGVLPKRDIERERGMLSSRTVPISRETPSSNVAAAGDGSRSAGWFLLLLILSISGVAEEPTKPATVPSVLHDKTL